MSNIFNNFYLAKQFFHSNSRAINRIGPHNKDVISIIFGLLLGNAYASNKSGEGVKFSIFFSSLSIKHKEYLFSLNSFFFIRGYTYNSLPKLCKKNIDVGNNIFSLYEFNTKTFRSFVWIYKLFYSKGKKIVKLELENYLTPMTLAVWFMSNGKFVKGRLQLNTNFHSSQDIIKLINMLNNRYGLISSMSEIKKGLFIIDIAKESINPLIAIVNPYITSNMKYKIDILLKIYNL